MKENGYFPVYYKWAKDMSGNELLVYSYLMHRIDISNYANSSGEKVACMKRSEICSDLGIGNVTVSRIVNSLIEKELIDEKNDGRKLLVKSHKMKHQKFQNETSDVSEWNIRSFKVKHQKFQSETSLIPLYKESNKESNEESSETRARTHTHAREEDYDIPEWLIGYGDDIKDNRPPAYDRNLFMKKKAGGGRQ